MLKSLRMAEPYLVLYRKYRPKIFSEVVNQEHIVKTLQNAVAMKIFGHAYLFSGPRGTGKTTIARLFAKLINCKEQINKPAVSPVPAGLKLEPCNNCDICKEFMEGRGVDLIEIDAASNRGIDEIRELKEAVRVPPLRSTYKVYIIDEVHQLTKEAFNALLKTLEEPPKHVVFVLATTEVSKVPDTILSRVQRFDFKRLPIPKIIGRLAKIAKEEKVDLEPDAARLIAANAEGSVRDAESILEQVIAFGENPVTKSLVAEVLGTVDFGVLWKFVGFLEKRDLKEVLKYIHQVSEEGREMKEFARGLIAYLRKLMMLRVDPELGYLFSHEVTEEELKALEKQAQSFSVDDLSRLIKEVSEARETMKYTNFPIIPLEVVIIGELSQDQTNQEGP